jgi:hypothetical protein
VWSGKTYLGLEMIGTVGDKGNICVISGSYINMKMIDFWDIAPYISK